MIEHLIKLGVQPTQAKAFGEPLKAAMALNAIDTEARQAAFIAHLMIESQNFTRLEENLRYTTERAVLSAFGKRALPHMSRILRNPQALANFVYANRNGNGDEASGDGWKYRGRGLIMTTGLENYRNTSQGVGLNDAYVLRPDMLTLHSDACNSAAWYWRANGCNQAIDAGMFDTTTRIINGKKMMHAEERRKGYAMALAVWNGAIA